MAVGKGRSGGGCLAGKALAVTNLLDYQKGAVVSRTIVDKHVGTVTLFAFAQGQGLSEHTAPYDALVHILDGQVEITIAGRPLRAKAGDIVMMPANKPHSLKAVKRFKMLLIMIRA
jgi:quercetin dioxygenase-like cupin family protein